MLDPLSNAWRIRCRFFWESWIPQKFKTLRSRPDIHVVIRSLEYRQIEDFHSGVLFKCLFIKGFAKLCAVLAHELQSCWSPRGRPFPNCPERFLENTDVKMTSVFVSC